MRIAKWGNSLAVRLPAKIVEKLGVKEGDDLSVKASGKRELILEVAKRERLSDDEFLAQIRQYRGMFPAGFKFDRDEANER